MLYRIVCDESEWHLVSHSRKRVITLAHRKLRDLPAGSQMTIFRGSETVGTIQKLSILDPEDELS